MRSFLIIILALFSLVDAALAAPAVVIGLDRGNYAPAFELPDLSGKIIHLADLKGFAVILNFWSTLCAPCTAEMPSLNRLSDALHDVGILVLAVSIDTSGTGVREFVAKNKLTLTVLLDRDKTVFFDQYAGPTLPVTYLINKHGMIVETYTGPQEWDSAGMKAKILKTLIQP